jgi:hypothetical protein
MQRSFQVGQIVEIKIIDDGFNPEDYYIVSIVAIHGSAGEIVYYTSNPKDAQPCDNSGEPVDIDLHFSQSRFPLFPLCLIESGFKISVNVL